jgi:hypothetical protein
MTSHNNTRTARSVLSASRYYISFNTDRTRLSASYIPLADSAMSARLSTTAVNLKSDISGILTSSGHTMQNAPAINCPNAVYLGSNVDAVRITAVKFDTAVRRVAKKLSIQKHF